MGKRLEALKTFLGFKFDKMVNLSDMERVELATKELIEEVNRISNSHAEAIGEAEYARTEIKRIKEHLNKIELTKKALVTSIEVAKSDGRSTLRQENDLEILYANKKSHEETLAMREQTLEFHEKAADKMGKLKAVTQAKLNSVRQLKSQLEIKENFAKAVKKYEDFNIEGGMTDISDALHNIEVKYNAADFKFKELSDEIELESMINSAGDKQSLEEWLKS